MVNFFFNDTATTEIYTLSLHDALPIFVIQSPHIVVLLLSRSTDILPTDEIEKTQFQFQPKSEEHTSELQSPCNLVCRLLLEKKKTPTLIL